MEVHGLKKQPLKKLTPEQVGESIALYESGESCGAIAARYGVSRQAMWDLLRRRIDLRAPRRLSPAEREERKSEPGFNPFERGGSLASDYAQNKAEKAVAAGKLIRPEICEECLGPGKPFKDGRSPIQAHHDDYNKPLEVRWLCQQCHFDWHRENRPVPRGGGLELPAKVDVIAGGF